MIKLIFSRTYITGEWSRFSGIVRRGEASVDKFYIEEEEEEEEEPLLIYTAQGSPFRRKKLSVINGSPEQQRTKTTLNI